MKVGATRIGRVDVGRERQGVRANAKGAMATSFAQLEKVLQRINKHDERAQLDSVERTSVTTQQKLLKDQLLKVQEELALAESSKSKLCETIGRLQHEKEEQEKQLKRLMTELAASRESHEVMVKKVDSAERASEDAQRSYVRSLSARVKTATELLSRLRLTGALGSCGELGDQLERGLDVRDGFPSHKRKRVEEPHCDATEDISSVDWACSVVHSAMNRVEVDEPSTAGDADMEDSTPGKENERKSATQVALKETAQECKQCSMMSESIDTLKADAAKELDAKSVMLKELQAEHDQLRFTLDQLNAELVVTKKLAEEKEETIQELNDALQIERSKPSAEDDEMKDSDQPDTAERIKILEDNLAQLNTYADHLEMIISQCPSCSVKLQSEGTQDSGK